MRSPTTTLGVVGAGAMGRGIAQIAAQAGCRVLLCDVRDGAAAEARTAVVAQWGRLVEKGRLSAEAAAAAGGRLEVVDGLPPLAAADLVVEAIVENLDAKRALFRQLDDIVRPDCVLATNTSSLSVTAIAAGTADPARVAGFHFFNPVPLMKVVEVVAGALTGDRALELLATLAGEWGHAPVRAADTPGFIVNHAGRGYVTEALAMLRDGVADVATIDAILRDAAGFKLGPFELLDLTGLDVSHPVMESIYRQYYDDPRYRPSPIAAQRLAAGLLGRKSGRGFYRYDGGANPAPALPAAPAWTGPVWVGNAQPDAADAARALLHKLGVRVEGGIRPSESALIVVTPLGSDVSACVAGEGLDALRTVGLDTLLPLARRRTLMRSPATDPAVAAQAQALFSADGVPASLIDDSAGFVAQRTLATIVNIGCEIVQQRVCSPADLDRAVELGLGYPQGPLAWGDALGAGRVLAILRALQVRTGDMRYRPSLWLVRRAELGMSLRD
ncbi:3-hydroxyacyl-CoA dehydrogenase [Azospira restricta]|uniref:3-hydroxyacyl-CoA dehydrogenase n=1 Tax=Azospira restricta TaxID=404405 RepID=A0A974SPA1_9RHOO|nr:3-hydroxyacyl-CoA dehydrogenase [Azospira restricta]QRJ63952.1 3-hydroxyacyl-CoA dehydrogenase [Azospira restricta]